MKPFARVFAALAFAVVCGCPMAQDFPTRPVRIIVPYAVGNTADILMRAMADELTRTWKQQVVIDNKLGSGGIIAMMDFKKARGDGHDYILGDVGILSINPAMFRKLPYDPVADLVPITDLLSTPWVFFTARTGEFKTLGQLIAAARANPGKYTFSSNGIGTPTFLAAEWLKLKAGIDLLHVPFRDGNQMRASAATGDITLLTTVMASARPVLARLTPLAVSAGTRNPAYPEVPTVVESGGPAGVELAAWSTLMARPETPKAVQQKVFTDVTAALQAPAIRKLAADLGLDLGGRPADEVAKMIEAEAKIYRELVETLKLQKDFGQ
jgi:tripartite-type tricarboxylate transporter receptor subunit TctC